MAVFDLFVPPTCLSCHVKLAKGENVLCDICKSLIGVPPLNHCDKCGAEISDEYCSTCAETDFCFEFSRSVYGFQGPIQHLIHELKYNGRLASAKYLAEGLCQFLKDNADYKGYNCIAAVPLHPVRKRERGFNQSELLARSLAKNSGLEYINPIKRKHYTKSQTLLHKDERLKNLSGAFCIRKGQNVTGKNVILVDDVFTTGSTLNEVSKVLLQAGASKVAGLTASRA